MGLPSNSLLTGKSFQSNAAKFAHPGLHIAIKYPKAEPKKDTMKISPNKTLQSLFIKTINVAASPKIHVPVTAATIRFNHNLLHCVEYRNPSGESPHFVSLNIPFLVKGTKKVSFISLQ